jgi:DNA-binding NarL/FixJ family response regulator
LFDSTHGCSNTEDAILVIVAARASRRDSLRALIASIEPRCLVEMAPSATDIALLPLGSPVNVLVLDLEFETRESLALIPLLAKRRPATAIVALYNAAHQAHIAGCQIWPWQQAEKALRRTLHGVASVVHLP